MKSIYYFAAAAGLVACAPEIDSLSRDVTPAIPPPVPPSLGALKIPEVPGLERYVKDREAAIVLGKALFWDSAAGSDGMACASCHFHAGADGRVINQISPGLVGTEPEFGRMRTGEGGPNYTLALGDFPLHLLEDPTDRGSRVVFDTNDVISSSGTFLRDFVSLDEGREKCSVVPDDFSVGGVNVRRAEPRNAPTVINAVFNFRNFWDGRANNHFNGVDPFGRRNPNARVLAFREGACRPEKVDLPNSSLASQAVGPLTSDFEMSCTGRNIPDIGRKLLPRRALEDQRVAPDDSVLGAHRGPHGFGLRETYKELIKAAFQDEYVVDRCTEGGYSQLERNFSLFFGLAIQLYESTLVSDETPFDDFVGSRGRAPQEDALTPNQRRGFELFAGKGNCAGCHKGALFSSAASDEAFELVERMAMSRGSALYDVGFYDIGVRPTAEDLGAGGKDPFGNPLSFSRQALLAAEGKDVPDDLDTIDPCTFDDGACDPVRGRERAAVDGSFKVPTLRNVELTGPYFHNGGQATLEQVVAFYNRGGDFENKNLHPDIGPLGLTSAEIQAIVEFMHALTDERVRCEAAPFDHPELRIPNGHHGDTRRVTDRNEDRQADDRLLIKQAVGRRGLGSGEDCLRPFHEGLRATDAPGRGRPH